MAHYGCGQQITHIFDKQIGVNMEITLRDYFAARALPVCYKFWMHDYYHLDCLSAEEIAKEVKSDFDESTMSLIADYSYEMADAMLKARESNKQE